MADIFGVILQSGQKSDLDLHGKKVGEWVGLAFGGNPFVGVPYKQGDLESVLCAIKPVLSPKSAFTVVLYDDTPLITTATVSNAVSELEANGGNALSLSRGFVFKTEFLLSCEKLFTPPHFYCDEEDFLTINDNIRFALVADVMRMRILKHHMGNGVLIYDTQNTYIDADVVIGRDVCILPFNCIKGKSVICEGATLLEGNIIEDSSVGEGAKIGPYARLRPQSKIGKNAKIGNFVEIKNSSVGENTKIAHLTYVGDATIGKDCNIGCGVVFANYDGKVKQKSVVGERVFIGSNVNLVAPVELMDGCFIAAGSTITDNVPTGNLAIARARQENKERKKS